MAKVSLVLALVLVLVAPALTQAAGTLPLSRTSVSLETGESESVTINNPTGARVYVVSVSNAFVAHANVSGNTVRVYGLSGGYSQIGLCSYDNYCNSISVNVDRDGRSSTGEVIFSRNSLSLNRNETETVRLSGSDYGYYVSSNSNTELVSAYISNNDLVVTGRNRGSATLSVCAHGSDDCDNLRVTVVGSGSVQGSVTYSNGTLVNDNGTIYIIYRNTKSGFANMSAFTGHGYKLSNVIKGSTHGIVNNEYVVSTANISHPWGSWIRNGNTIYFVHEFGLIPISHYDVFINNGGTNAKVVQMNAHDVGKPVLPVMVTNDQRLR